jgi:hypothetical protein
MFRLVYFLGIYIMKVFSRHFTSEKAVSGADFEHDRIRGDPGLIEHFPPVGQHLPDRVIEDEGKPMKGRYACGPFRSK